MNILLSIMLIFSSFLSPMSASGSASVLSTICYVYSEANFESNIVKTLNHGETVNLLEEEGDFYKVSCEDKIEGFVYKFYLTQNQNSQDVIPVFNGKVIVDNAVIYGLDEKPIEFSPKKGQGVYIYGGFNDKIALTRIAIVIDDGSLFYGLVRTSDISPYGISAGLITAITIIVSLVTIITAVVFIKKVKKKKSK